MQAQPPRSVATNILPVSNAAPAIQKNSRNPISDCYRLLTLRLKSTGRRVDAIPADPTKAADVHRVAERLKSDSKITTLVNDAGIGSAGKLPRFECR